MIWIKKHWYLILIVAAFALGFLVSGGQKVNNKQFEREIKIHQDSIQAKQLRIDQLNKASQTMIAEVYRNKVYYDSVLKRKDERILQLTQRIRNAPKLDHANNVVLDSIVYKVLYPN